MSHFYRMLLIVFASALTGMAGCIIVAVDVTNPVPGLTTVAVAPFFNVSQEPVVDGRQFALAYYAELQKTPGFQVVPVGIVEQAIRDNRLQMSSGADACRLADILGVDAVVVGAVTDYSPYYPPRVGLQVSWYSNQPWTFSPSPPVTLDTKRAAKDCRPEHKPHWYWPFGGSECAPETGAANLPTNVVRAQSPATIPVVNGPPTTVAVPSFDPTVPFMSYTRLFDGADAKLTARLRDYVELNGDLRAGGWEAYLQRSDDYIRFTAHLMVVEMLQLHGGEARRRIVFKMRNSH